MKKSIVPLKAILEKKTERQAVIKTKRKQAGKIQQSKTCMDILLNLQNVLDEYLLRLTVIKLLQ